jgi:ubiquinone/menaquinone biosynthesis C-methylase UbiE
MMSILQDSWSNFSSDVARKYLKSFGSPSEESKKLLADILLDSGGGRPLKLIELGCGNGQLAEYLFDRELDFTYTGVDFSDPLLKAGQERFAGNSAVRFVKADIHQLLEITSGYDYAIYSHVIEILSSPETALKSAKRIADRILIRFFEPPEHADTTVEIVNLNIGRPDAPLNPYLRWTLGRDYYRLILAKLGVQRVDVYRTATKDQVHVLHFV